MAKRRSRRRVRIEARPPIRTEDQLARMMGKLNAAALAYVRAEIIPRLPATKAELAPYLEKLGQIVGDALPDEDVQRSAQRAAKETNRAGARTFAAAVTAATGLAVLGSDIVGGGGGLSRPRGVTRALARRPNIALDLAVDSFTDNTIKLISTLRAGVVDGVGDAIVRAYAFDGNPETLAPRLLAHWEANGVPSKIPTRRLNSRGEPVFVSAKSHADLIARDQLQKLHGRLNEERQRAAGVDRYTWTTQGDDRVRPEHAAREGRTFSWDRPPDEGHPGEPIACRCYAEAVIDRGQILNSEGYVEIEFDGPFSERQSPEGITLINPGPGAML